MLDNANRQEVYGRILNFYVCRINTHQRNEEYFIAKINIYPKIVDQRKQFKYYTILAKSARTVEKFVNVATIRRKCIFLSWSELPKVNGQDIYLAKILLNRVRYPNPNLLA